MHTLTSMASRIRWAVPLACVILLATNRAAPAEPEEAVKAAFVYNFSKFVEWPESASSGGGPIDICVLGADGIAPVLKGTVRDKTVKGRPLSVHDNVPLRDLGGCRVIYIPSSEQRRLQEVLERVRGLPILTVGDADSLAERGGMIALHTDENRVRFEVNLGAARRAGLKLGSQLLKVATRVVDSPP